MLGVRPGLGEYLAGHGMAHAHHSLLTFISSSFAPSAGNLFLHPSSSLTFLVCCWVVKTTAHLPQLPHLSHHKAPSFRLPLPLLVTPQGHISHCFFLPCLKCYQMVLSPPESTPGDRAVRLCPSLYGVGPDLSSTLGKEVAFKVMGNCSRENLRAGTWVEAAKQNGKF